MLEPELPNPPPSPIDSNFTKAYDELMKALNGSKLTVENIAVVALSVMKSILVFEAMTDDQRKGLLSLVLKTYIDRQTDFSQSEMAMISMLVDTTVSTAYIICKSLVTEGEEMIKQKTKKCCLWCCK